jgi:hypothetical protein
LDGKILAVAAIELHFHETLGRIVATGHSRWSTRTAVRVVVGGNTNTRRIADTSLGGVPVWRLPAWETELLIGRRSLALSSISSGGWIEAVIRCPTKLPVICRWVAHRVTHHLIIPLLVRVRLLAGIVRYLRPRRIAATMLLLLLLLLLHRRLRRIRMGLNMRMAW